MIRKAVSVVVLLGAPALARGEPPRPGAVPAGGSPGVVEDVRAFRHVGPGADRIFIAAEASDGKVVKNAPYSATATTEIEQVLGDGNRIRQKTTASVVRDREGRTRREVALGAVGPLVAGPAAEKMIFISDPVAGVSVSIDPSRKVAHKMPRFTERLPPEPNAPPPGARGADVDVLMHAPVPPPLHAPLPAPMFFGAVTRDLPKPRHEELGTQTMEGVRVQGTRSTVTIEAGKIGNERPLVITTERWVAPDLGGVVVMSRHSDPRLGTTTYRLTELVRSDPDRALFEIPAGIKVEEGPAGGDRVIIRRELRRAPAKPE